MIDSGRDPAEGCLPSLGSIFSWLLAVTNYITTASREFAILRGWVHQFSSHMHKFFSHKLTGISLSTLDHGFITWRTVFRSTLCFIGYTTIFLWILEKCFIFYVSITRRLPGSACASELQSFHYWLRNMTYWFCYWMYYYLLARVLPLSNVNSTP